MIFFELIQVALGTRNGLSKMPSDEEWLALFEWCDKQAIAGFVFSALEKLSDQGQKPPMDLLYEWIGLAEQVKSQNRIVNRNAVELSDSLKNDGFEGCILKGQGNALLYLNPLSRQPGDIDVWVRPKLRIENGELKIKEIVRYVKARNPEGDALYHHIDDGTMNGVEVEVHYRPSFMFNPLHNRRLQLWFVSHAEEQFQHEVELPDGAGRVCVPTLEFNVVFQLSHVYNHLLHEGIGLKQVIDYYFLLKSRNNNQLIIENGKLKSLGLGKIAGAMMWVMHEVLGLEEKYLIAPMDEKRGKVLLAEIMRGGNFGFYDAENQRANDRVKKNIQRVKRDLRMMKYFPSECLWEPAFRFYHFFWRMRYN